MSDDYNTHDDDDVRMYNSDEIRNTAPGRRRPRGPGPRFPHPSSRPPPGGGMRPRPGPGIIRPRPAPGPAYPIGPTAPHGHDNGEYLTIRKSDIADLVPILGQAWVSLLARPGIPVAVGDDIIDRDNAAMHRDALALHQQNQTRILVLTDLIARAVKLFV